MRGKVGDELTETSRASMTRPLALLGFYQLHHNFQTGRSMQLLQTHTFTNAVRGVFITLSMMLIAACSSEAQETKQPQADTGTAAPSSGTLVLLKTSEGDIELSLDAEKAPVSVENFLAYADSGHYEGTIFHRVIDDFMVQGGGFDRELQKKATRDPIKNEAANGLKNLKYTIAMARTQVWDSATAQFFINVADNAFLDKQYAVFGTVVSGKDVVDKIAAVKTGAAGRFRSDVPTQTIVIESVSRK